MTAWLGTVCLLTVFVALRSMDLGAVGTTANLPALSSSDGITYRYIAKAIPKSNRMESRLGAPPAPTPDTAVTEARARQPGLLLGGGD